jgi:hypothetical protein
MVVAQMFPRNELVRDRQNRMLDEAAVTRQARRVQALHRANRRAERAQRQLTRSYLEAMRLTELIAP